MVITLEPGARELELAPVRGLLEQVVARWKPAAIWLFGSRARGDSRGDSDWDLLVVVSDDAPERLLRDPLVAWRLLKKTGAPADLVVCTRGEFEEDRGVPNTLAFEVATDGVQLYER